MKTYCVILSLALFANLASAQFNAGIKLNLGAGNITSVNLVKNLDYQRGIDKNVAEWSVKERWGFGFGFGGFVGYNFSDKFSCLGEPTINFLKSGIDFTRVDNNLASNSDGNIKTESTVSDIHVTYFNLPLLARYIFTESKFFVQGGIGINFTGTPTIKSTANSRKDDYKNGTLDKTTIDPLFTLETKLNVFNNPRFDFVLGLGKSFDISGKNLTIDIRYNLPLTKSEMFTTDSKYNDGVFKQNDLLGIDGKADAEKNAPYLLNDFKMSVFAISLGYTLFSK